MSKGNTFINDILNLVFCATPIANIADNAAISPNTSLYVSLHTGSPGGSGSQTSSEAAYPGYTRVAVPRTSSGWIAATAQFTGPVSAISFPTSTGGSETETHFAVGTSPSGTGKVICFGTVTPNLAVTVGKQPQLNTATTITET
jgi:hypothetical protein